MNQSHLFQPQGGGTCLHHAFEARAAAAPDSIALVFEDQRLTYRELNERGNQLAHYLLGRGVQVESLVGLYLERSLAMVVGILGILKTGAAYVPLDPIYPRERVTSILEDARITMLITENQLLTQLPELAVNVVCLDSERTAIARERRENPVAGAGPGNLAYVIYTSGSTGRPKGVQVTHATVVHLFESAQQLLEFDERDVWTVSHSCSFDLSVWEIWGCLLRGGRLIVVPRPLIQSPVEFYDLLCRERVTVLNQTPSALRQLIYAREKLASATGGTPVLRLVICGGEALPRAVARRVLEWNVPVWNFYGPTEATVWATAIRLEASDCEREIIPIGQPLPGIKTYILDDQLRPVTPGTPGELHIGGACLARGYLDRPALTASKFIHDPFSADAGARLYKTGDVGRTRSDGNLEFLGRIDDQVKINGFRVELGEIEAVLNEHPAVRECLVTLQEDLAGHQRLTAYTIAADQSPPPTSQLRGFLKRKLPEYMLPAAFVWLSQFPLTPNGKIDRRALPGLGEARAPTEREIAPATDPLHLQLIRIWQKTLGVHPIGIRDNFFDLGGESFLAVKVFAEIQEICGKDLPLATLVQSPTIEQLAGAIQKEGSSVSWASLVPIQEHGSRRPFFCVHAVGGNVLNYFDLSRRLGPDQPFYALQAQGLDGKHPPFLRIEDMAAHYVKEIRAFQPEGPYVIGGESFGGIVAFEMAQQLHAQGQTVPLLVLLDATAGPEHLRPMIRKIPSRLHLLWRLSPRQKLEFARAILRRLAPRGRSKFSRNQHMPDVEPPHTLPPVLEAIARINDRAHQSYVPRPYPGRAVLFRARESPWSGDLGWRRLVLGGVEIQELPGGHTTFINEPHVKVLAAALESALLRA